MSIFSKVLRVYPILSWRTFNGTSEPFYLQIHYMSYNISTEKYSDIVFYFSCLLHVNNFKSTLKILHE